MKSYFVISSHPITRFLFDGRPKIVVFFNASPKIIHIDIECIQPQTIWTIKPYERYENINIFFFPSDFTLMYTNGHRYIELDHTWSF